jgi:hypothetical protein
MFRGDTVEVTKKVTRKSANHAVLVDDELNRGGGMIPEVLAERGVEEYMFIRLCRTLRTDYR